MCLFLFRAESTNNANVCSLSTFGNVLDRDEVDGVSASRHFRVRAKAVDEASDFEEVGMVPQIASTAVAKFIKLGNKPRLRAVLWRAAWKLGSSVMFSAMNKASAEVAAAK